MRGVWGQERRFCAGAREGPTFSQPKLGFVVVPRFMCAWPCRLTSSRTAPWSSQVATGRPASGVCSSERRSK